MTIRAKGTPLINLIPYTVPKLHTGKTWYVDFFAFDPLSGTLRRKKYHLDSIPKKSDRVRRATEIISAVYQRLITGWSPWVTTTSEKEYSTFTDAIELYRIYVNKMSDTGSMKKKTRHDYLSRLKTLEDYNTRFRKPIIYSYQFDTAFVSDFLDYIFLSRDSSPRTRNNYRTWLSAFSGWMLERNFIETNPVEGVKVLSENVKFRSAISPEDLKQMQNYLREKNPHYLLACMMEYYTFIRPDELSNIRLGDIRLKEQKVFISSVISKNRRDGMVGLNDRIIHLMLDLNVFESPSSAYLFGRNFRPSEEKADSRIFRDEFVKLRKALRWPSNYQFYSLKDSGIRDLANAEGIVVARDQARHSDVSTTNCYLKGDSMTVHEETKHFKGNL